MKNFISILSLNNLRKFRLFNITCKFIRDSSTTTTNERLNIKAKNVGDSSDQIQNYERHRLTNKNEKITNVENDLEKDLENLFDIIESTNSDYLKNTNNPTDMKVKVQEMTFTDYMYITDKLINALVDGFNELLKYESNIKIEKDPRNFHLKINVKGVGIYIISKEVETRQISLTSPISGLFKYQYDPVSQYWVSTKDTHIMDDLLIREFCKHSKGLLEIKI
jgi:frataxin-like iron-binding protein CyaY